MRYRGIFSRPCASLRRGALILALLAISVAACAPAIPTVNQPTASPTASATPAVLPSPVAALLDPPPLNCPTSPPLQSRGFTSFGGFQGGVSLIGHAPVWVPSLYFPQTPVDLELSNGYTPWPGTKIIWEVGPNYSKTVRVTVTDLATGQLAWWGQNEDGPDQSQYGSSQTLTLDATSLGPAAYHGPSETGWNEWGSFVYLLHASCYALDVTWPGGHWRSIFGAGR